ncbi:hypothetical protein B0T17DRAFT_509756 [Bombardia bombarda]|uniref:Tyrosinase copper-binding domain-containing protein n=1 Tax=Bombardia bombarda TaxID=252184 RepID=A0AA39WML9_9PEZI|nr:hypothetical protein B0T17DRAFT_509756 [Bombardia bombarda]
MSLHRLSLLVLVVVVSLAHSVLAQYTPYDYRFDVNQKVKRQVGQPFIVRGAGSGAVQLRQEIRQLQQDTDQWTLYILGLSLLQFTDQTSPTSWYGLTGIHGIPHKTWGGVGPTPGNENTGYCTHSSVLFPTWHRPYLALYEQVLYQVVQQIATWWPEGAPRQRYQAAAANFRIPYWDWAASPPSGQSVLPLSVGGSQYVEADGPNGVQTISNPLFAYTFQPFNATAMVQYPWNIWESTVRSPTTNGTDAASNNALVAVNFDQNVDSLAQRLYIIFSNYNNYSTFSNNAWIPAANNGTYDSLEALHDTVHNLAGGGGQNQPNPQGGHMSYIPYSAFDPIFFLHHTMVDRIFAIWQALHPESWVMPEEATLASYTTTKGQTQDSTTPLTPFFAGVDGTFWTSDMVRDHTRLGYTYAELVGVPAGTSASQQGLSTLKRTINRLYGGSSPVNMFFQGLVRGVQGKGSKRGEDKAASLVESREDTGNTSALEPRSGAIFVGNQYREWIANIRVKQQALDGPFSIHLFMGKAPADPRNWQSAPNHVGTMGVFASDDDDSGMDMGHLTISGTIPLTSSLIRNMGAGGLSSLEPRDAENYLKRNLRAQIVTAKGRIFDPKGIDSFGMHIVSSVVRVPSTEDELPAWGPVVSHFDLK